MATFTLCFLNNYSSPYQSQCNHNRHSTRRHKQN
uniref:Uncharacterized protein n=1 Tax=Anguilla anguilla TaxID=7936 RepID=A0A0E9QWA4_ANGAN